MSPNTDNLIGSGVVFNVEAFFKELAQLESKGLPRVHERIHISSRWQSSTKGARTWSDIPSQAQKYIEFIESSVGIKVCAQGRAQNYLACLLNFTGCLHWNWPRSRGHGLPGVTLWAYHFLGGTAYDFSFQGDYQGGRLLHRPRCQVWQVARVE